jgi:hypothetical protein
VPRRKHEVERAKERRAVPELILLSLIVFWVFARWVRG